VLFGALLIAGVAVACDIKDTQHYQDVSGPPLRVLMTNVEGTNATIPSDGAIQLVFDRYLLPSLYKRQAFVVLDANREPLNGVALQTIYDPVALTVTITGPGGYGTRWLTPGQTYYLILNVADDARDTVEDLSGFRAIDRAPLAERREYIFRAGGPSADGGVDAGVSDGGDGAAVGNDAGRADAETQARLDPVIDFCADVMPIFKAKCTNAVCHSAKGAAAGLILESAEGIFQTAVNRVAHGSNTGRQGDTAESATRLFGINMPIITPGDPGASWLMYKVDLAAKAVIDAGPVPDITCSPPAGSPSIPPRSKQLYTLLTNDLANAVDERFAARDRSVLSNYVLGREMPYPYPPGAYLEPDAYKYTPLTFQERERIRIWIADRAPLRECGGCGVIEN
jgi:hypothetical protein